MEEIPEVADFLSTMKELITFIWASSKRINIFKSIKLQLIDDEEEDGRPNRFTEAFLSNTMDS